MAGTEFHADSCGGQSGRLSTGTRALIGVTLKLNVSDMNSNPYTPPTEIEPPAANHLPLSVSALFSVCVVTLLGFGYLTVVGMVTYVCLRFPGSSTSGHLQAGAFSALFAAICLVAVIRLKTQRTDAYWWVLISPGLLALWIVAPWVIWLMRP